jgi:thioredoxin-dependent peroxiredoxin
MLQVGEPAPEFEARDGNGATVRLGELRGRPVVLYFYPKDDTPGCTKEARIHYLLPTTHWRKR